MQKSAIFLEFDHIVELMTCSKYNDYLCILYVIAILTYFSDQCPIACLPLMIDILFPTVNEIINHSISDAFAVVTDIFLNGKHKTCTFDRKNR